MSTLTVIRLVWILKWFEVFGTNPPALRIPRLTYDQGTKVLASVLIVSLLLFVYLSVLLLYMAAND